MSAHRRVLRSRATLRRTFTAAVVAVASGVGLLASAGPALAAGPWFVAPTTASPAGANTASCGLAASTPCATVTFVLTKAAFADGDTINVAAGTYTDRPAFAAKSANIVGASTASTIFSGSATGSAIAVNVTNTKTFTLSNLTLTAGKAANGAALAITTGKVVLNSVNITNSVASNAGGAVAQLAAAGSLTINGGTFSGNSATAGGGAVYSAGTTALNAVTLSGNTSANGGAVYSPAGATTTVTNGSVTGNNGTSAGGGLYNLGTLTVNGTSITSNTSPVGGGIAAAGGTLTSATITGNNGTTEGGGVFENTQTMTINGGTTISGNSSPLGAGIYQQAGTTNVTASSITNNTSSNTGAGYYVLAGAFNATGATITGNSATTLAGAGALVAGTSTITNGTLSSNSALNGGALYNGGTTTIDGTTITGNAANGGTTANGGNAGAIYNAAALVVKNATFNANKAVANTNSAPGVAGYGGAIGSFSLSSSGAPTISFTNTTINGDNAGTPVSGGNATIGGAIAALGNIGAGGANTVITATGLTLSKNVALAAGGIYTTGTTTLTNSALTANQATHASAGLGGGIYGNVTGAAPTITLDNTAVTRNTGVAGGGGLVLAAGVTTVVKNGSTVSGNSGAIGAGIYNAGNLSLTGSHVDTNNASNSGGGIYSASNVTLTNTSVNGNTAAFLGGGLSTTSTAGGFTMSGGTVSGNNAFGAGGVFISDNLTGSFDGTNFIGNTSTGANFGGGALLSGGAVTIDHATLSGNTADGASGSGGAIFSGSSNDNVTTSLKLSNSTLTGNDSYVGAAIFAGSSKTTSTNKTSITNTTITANAASGPFGAIEATDPVSIVGSTITDNTAVPTSPYDAYGGIVAQSAGQVSIAGSILSGNNGHQCNVAVADGGSNLNSPTASECAFSASKGDLFAAPQLGALANNGGPTQTLLPGPASPALDKIVAGTSTGIVDAITGNAVTLCSGGSDQRGIARPQGAKCDIGAVEVVQVAPTVSGPSAFTYSVGIAGAPQTYTSTGTPQATLSASGLPAGVTFTDHGDGTGTISGTPAGGTGGVYTVTVKATNEAGSGTETVTLTVNQAPLLAGPAGATYTVGTPGGPTTFTTTGHPTPTLSSTGLLPGGVGFTDNGDGTGAYAGTPAAGTGGIYNLTVNATNGTPPDASAPFKLTVNEAPAISGPGSAVFKVGMASSSSPDFTGSGFPTPTLSATGLPSGLSLVSTGPDTAQISGTAANSTGGDYPGVVVKADNGVGTAATKTVDVTVNEAPELTGPTDARFVTGSANSIGFSSDGFPQAALTESGALPSGLTFHDNGNGSATISGTAAANALGSYAITVTASNGQSPDAVIHLSLEVVPPLSIATTSLPNAAYRSTYSAQLMANGGQPGYTYAVTVGQLPAGLSMNAFGLISGSPTVSTGTYLFTVKATDSAHPAQTATKILSIKVTKGSTRTTPTAILLGFVQNGDITINAGLVEADLKGGFPEQPIAGETITFKSGTSTVCSGKTDANGHAQCSQTILNAILTPLRGNLTATFSGDLNWFGSSGTATLIQKTPTP